MMIDDNYIDDRNYNEYDGSDNDYDLFSVAFVHTLTVYALDEFQVEKYIDRYLTAENISFIVVGMMMIMIVVVMMVVMFMMIVMMLMSSSVSRWWW
jgi:hypothetical protein